MVGTFRAWLLRGLPIAPAPAQPVADLVATLGSTVYCPECKAALYPTPDALVHPGGPNDEASTCSHAGESYAYPTVGLTKTSTTKPFTL